MMRWIIGSSLKLRFVIVAVAALMLGLGFTQLGDMPVDVLPEFELPYVEIQTESLGMSAEELEAIITVTLEQDMLSQVTWTEKIYSETMPGLSKIRLYFKPGIDIIKARQVVQEQLVMAFSLPHVGTPPVMVQPLSSSSRVMNVGLSSDKLSLIEMSVLARWTIKPRLLGVPGVANVSIYGQRKRQVHVQVDPERLRDKGVTLDQIVETTGNALWFSPVTYLEASTPGVGGFIDTPNQRLAVRHFSPIKTAEDLSHVMVTGTDFQLSEVATLTEDHQPLIGDAIVDGNSNLMLVIERFPWAYTVEVTNDVEAALASLQHGMKDLKMDKDIYRPATYIENATGNMKSAFLFGAVLAVLMLGAFVFNWRTALISAVSIGLSLICAAFIYSWAGGTFNFVVIAGLALALGVIIDDGIIDARNIVKRIRQSRGSGKPVAKAILDASFEMRSAMLYATVIVFLTAVPAYFMAGIAGEFTRSLVSAYVLAVAVSTLVALLVAPALSLLLLRNASPNQQESPVVRAMQRIYDAAFAGFTTKPVAAIAAVAVILIIGLVTMPFLQQPNLVPEMKETDLLVRFEAKPGTSQPAMSRIVSKATHDLRAIKGVKNVGAHVGRAILSDESVNVNTAEIWVRVDPSADYSATVANINKVVHNFPGQSRDVITYLKEKTSEAATRLANDAVIRIYGHDLDELEKLAGEMKQTLARVNGLSDLRIDGHVKEPNIEVKVDLERAKRHGIKPGDVRRASAILMQGIEVGSLFEEQKVFDVVVWATPEHRESINSFRNLLIDTPSGGHVRVGEVADVRVVPTTAVIKREAVSRYIDVVGKVSGSHGNVKQEIEQILAAKSYPLEYRAELLENFAGAQFAKTRFFGFTLAAAFGILLILQAFFGSWRLATAVFLTLPSALIGGLLAAFIAGGGITLGSVAGFIAVFGIAARQCISLVNRYQHLENEGETFGAELVKKGTRDHFASIVLTAATIALAFVPVAFFGNIGGTEILQPMAIVLLGGLVTSTLYNVLAVPSIYLRFGANRESDFELFHGELIGTDRGTI